MSVREILLSMAGAIDDVDQIVHWTIEDQGTYADSDIGREQKQLVLDTRAELSRVRGYLGQAIIAISRYESGVRNVDRSNSSECP